MLGVGVILGRFISKSIAAVALASVGFAVHAQESSTPAQTLQTADKKAVELPVNAPQEMPSLIPTADFAAQSDLSSAQLSPDGSKMAARVNFEGEANILIIDVATMKPVRRAGIGSKLDMEWFEWAGNDRILFSVSKQGRFDGEDVRYTRLYALDLNAMETHFIGVKEPIVDGDDVLHVAEDGSFALLSIQRSIYDYPSVMRFELDGSGKKKQVQSPRDGVWNWYADSAGVVRIGTGYFNGRLKIFYRSSEDDDLDLVGRFREGDNSARFWRIAHVNAGSDSGYVLQEGENGRIALRSFNFLERKAGEVIYENPDWDVDSALIAKDDTPKLVTFTDDRQRVVYFNEVDRKRLAMLEEALPEEHVSIISRAADDSRMIIWAGGAADPGGLYMFDVKAKSVGPMAEMRSGMRIADLTRPQKVTYKARDGLQIPAYLTLPKGREAKGLPLIVMPHGGPYGVRDELSYNDEVQLLANRGYAVLQPNYRGSGGYGRAFSALGRGQIGRKMQDDIDDAMDWAVAEGIADRDRVCVVGGSYGGYAALWAVLRNPERYRCAASWAGVTDWDSQLRYDRDFFTRYGARRWRERVQGEDGFDLDDVSPAKTGETLSRPVLLAHGDEDTNVPFSQFKKMRSATSKAPVKPQLLVIEGEGHSFSSPANEQAWYDALVKFLAEHNPSDVNGGNKSVAAGPADEEVAAP